SARFTPTPATVTTRSGSTGERLLPVLPAPHPAARRAHPALPVPALPVVLLPVPGRPQPHRRMHPGPTESETSMSPALVFLDTETTGLDVDHGHGIWEFAAIRREPDGTETE